MPVGVRGFQKGNRAHGKAPHTIEASKMREYLVTRIAEKMEPLIDAQMDLATGIFYEKADGRIYQREPDPRVGEYLINQGAGRPTESIQLANKDNLPFIIKVDS